MRKTVIINFKVGFLWILLIHVAQSLDIKHYLATSSQLSVNSTYRNYIENSLMLPVKDYFTRAIEATTPGTREFQFPATTTCGTGRLLKGPINQGVIDTDLYLHYYLDNSFSSASNVLAFASSCLSSQIGSKRPNLVYISLNAKKLQLPNSIPHIHDDAINVLIHEILHGIAGSSNLALNWINPITQREYEIPQK